jgi:hypothetical protein
LAPRFSRPRLIDANDTQYRAFVRQIMIGKDNQRATRPPLPRELFGGEAEAALRDWLARHFTLSERRIVEYLEHRGRSAIKKYRELDAVVLPDPKSSIQVFEIKASQKAASVRRAAHQLHETRTILGMLFRRVHTTILLVDTGIPTAADVAELMASEDAPTVPPPTLDEVLAALPQVRLAGSLEQRDSDPEVVSLLRFGVEDIVALAGADNLHLNWDEQEEDEPEALEEPAAPARPSYAYSTEEPSTDDADDDNPLAAALRKAMEGERGGKAKK